MKTDLKMINIYIKTLIIICFNNLLRSKYREH